MRIVSLLLLVAIVAGCTNDEQPAEYAFNATELEGCSTNIATQTWTLPPEQAEATFLFVNGRTEYTDKYHHLIDMMEVPWNVIMYDHYGQGRSGGVRAHGLGMDEQLACDLGAVLDELADPELPIVAAGHSTGGMALVRYAQLQPARFEAIVLSSPLFQVAFPDGLTQQDVKMLTTSAIEAGNAEMPAAEDMPPPDCADNQLTRDCEMYNQFKDDPLTLIGPPTWGWLDMVFEGEELIDQDLDQLDVPIRLHQAGDEQIVVPEAQTNFCDGVNAMGATSCELRVFEDARHELFMELDRQTAMAETLEFLAATL